MIGHLVLSVSDFKTSEPYYDQLMKICGWHIRWKETENDCIIKSYGVEGSPTALMIREDKKHESGTFTRYPGLDHLCIKVKSQEVVNEAFNFIKSQEVLITRKPKDYEFSDPYHAFYFRDPDGIPLEVAYY